MNDWTLNDSFKVEERFIKYGIRGSGPPVVVVHGTPWSSYNMRHIIEALTKKFTVYYYDLIGYGQSDQSAGDVSLGIQNQILSQLIDLWELDSPAIIGHDFGGATVLRTHLLDKRDFEKIILIDPVSISPWGSPFFQHVNQYESAFAGVPDYIHEAIVRAYIGTAAFTPLDDETVNMTVSPWLTGTGKSAFYRQIAQAKERYTDEAQIYYSEINKPVMILWGAEDTWIPVERGRQLHKMIPNSTFHEIPDSGHLVIEEQANLLIEKILPFLLNQEFI